MGIGKINNFKSETIEYSRDSLETIVIVNVISIIWFILPSVITIEGPKFKFKIED